MFRVNSGNPRTGKSHVADGLEWDADGVALRWDLLP